MARTRSEVGGPYRAPASAEPIARFLLRTPLTYRAIAATTFGVTAAVVAVFVWGTIVHGTAGWLMMLLALALVVVVTIWWQTTRAYRIGGGRGELLVYPDHVEVPGASAGTIVHLPLATLAIDRSAVVLQMKMMGVPLAALPRGELITMRSAGAVRKLSTLASSDVEFADRLVDIVTRTQLTASQREMFDGLASQIGAAFFGTKDERKSAVRDELDERIDAELTNLQD